MNHDIGASNKALRARLYGFLPSGWILSGFLAVTPCAAQSIDMYRPDSVCPGEGVRVQGRNFQRPRPTGWVIKYGRGKSVLGEIPEIVEWRNRRIDVQLPSSMPSGTFWLGIARGAADLLVQGPETLHIRTCTTVLETAPVVVSPTSPETVVSQATRSQIVRVPSCDQYATVRVDGGPFEPGTGQTSGRSWQRGRTFIELREFIPAPPAGSLGLRTNPPPARLGWDPIVRVLNPSRLEATISTCFMRLRYVELRVVLPNGTRTNWVRIRNVGG